MKAKTNVIVQGQDGNSSKPLLCEVAVVTPRFRDYLEFIRNQKNENEKYCFVDSIQSVRGKLFNRVEKLHNYFHIKDIDEILDYLETHLHSNLR